MENTFVRRDTLKKKVHVSAPWNSITIGPTYCFMISTVTQIKVYTVHIYKNISKARDKISLIVTINIDGKEGYGLME